MARRGRVTVGMVAALLVHGTAHVALAQSARDAAVELSATVALSPPTISLSWAPLPGGVVVSSVTLWRYNTDGTVVGPLQLGGTALAYVDTQVQIGMRYSYVVQRISTYGLSVGRIWAGIELPAVHERGAVALVVDAALAPFMAQELAQLRDDLHGDGWRILEHAVQPTASVVSVRALLAQDAQDHPDLTTVFLLGAVPQPYSGLMSPDGHGDHYGAWPTDQYYSALNATWTDTTANNTGASGTRNDNVPGDGKWDQSAVSGGLLQVGRVDLRDMPAFAAPGESTAEVHARLLRRYLGKDHAWRHAQWDVPERALVDDSFGYFSGEAFAASGWANFSALVGRSNVAALDWFTTLRTQPHLLAFGAGGGTPTSAGGVGTTADFAQGPSHAVFTLLFGSYFGDWGYTDNFLRAPLAAAGYGLTSAWSGRPKWWIESLGMGEPIGLSALNNMSSTYLGLMGDPTLRLHPVAPAGPVTVDEDGGLPRLTWAGSTHAGSSGFVGYHVYRSTEFNTDWVRLTDTAVTTTSWVDTSPVGGARYMVRAQRLQPTNSGSYHNLSQGVFARYVPGQTNTPPMASAVANQTTDEDLRTGWVAWTVADAEQDAASLTLSATSSNLVLVPPGHVEFGGSGTSRTFRVMPGNQASGTATITLTVSDGTASTSVSFLFTVNNVNDTPVANAQTVDLQEDTSKTFTLTGRDAEGTALTYAVTRLPTRGTLSGTPPTLTYVPSADLNGNDTLQFTVSDGTTTSVPATVTLRVAAVNDAPRLVPQELTTPEDTTLRFTVVAVDPEGSSYITVTSGSSPQGTVEAVGPLTFDFVPGVHFAGTAAVTLLCSDGLSTVACGVTITVTSVPDAPRLDDLTVHTPQDVPVDVPWSGVDGDGDPLVYAVVLMPRHGSFTGEAPLFTYTPHPGFSGVDTLVLSVMDPSGLSAQGTLTVDVQGEPPPPGQGGDIPMVAGPFVAQAWDDNNHLWVPITQDLVEFDRLILAVASDPSSVPTVADARGNAWVRDSSTQHSGAVRTSLFSALMTQPLRSGDVVQVSFGGTTGPTAKVASAASFRGLVRSSNPRDRARAQGFVQADHARLDATSTTQQALELAVHVVGMEGALADLSAAQFNDDTQPFPVQWVAQAATVAGPTPQQNVALGWGVSTWRTAGLTQTSLTWQAPRSGVVAQATYRAGPVQVRLSHAGGVPTLEAGPAGCAGPFEVTLLGAQMQPVAPSQATWVEVSSNSTGARLWQDSACTQTGAPATSALRLEFRAGAVTTRTFYLTDTLPSDAPWVLTAQRTSGDPRLTVATLPYRVETGPAFRAWVVLAGQEFVAGAGATGTPQNARTQVPFGIRLHLTDRWNNPVGNTPLLAEGTVDVVLGGLDGNPTFQLTDQGACASGCQATGVMPLPVTFVDGVSTGQLVVLAELAQPTAQLVASMDQVMGVPSSSFAVLARESGLAVGPMPGAPSQGVAARPTGEFGLQFSNPSNNPLTRLRFRLPTGWTAASNTLSTTDGFFSRVPAPTGVLEWEDTWVWGGLPSGGTASLWFMLDAQAYPNVAQDTAFSVTVEADEASGARWVGSLGLDVLVPLGPPRLAMGVRDGEAGSRPTLSWTGHDQTFNGTLLEGPRARVGTLVVRGTGRLRDGATYVEGQALASGSHVVCVVPVGRNSCQETDQVPMVEGAATYQVYQQDAQDRPLYSAPALLVLPAKPSPGKGFVFSSEGGVALTAPGLRRGSATQAGVVVVPTANRGLFFVRSADGQEERRAEPLGSTLRRRPSVLTLSTQEQAVLVVESDAQAHYRRVDPAGLAQTTSWPVNQAVVSSVVAVQAAQLKPLHAGAAATLNSAYISDVMVFGTNDPTHNTVRALKPTAQDTQPQYWSYALPSSDEAVRAEAYVDYARAWVVVPVAGGAGGLLGFDLSDGAGTALPPPPPSGWSEQRILQGVPIQCQPRKIQGAYVVGAYTSPGAVFAVWPTAPEPPLGVVSLTLDGQGPVKQVVPVGTGGVLYATVDGHVGRLLVGTAPLRLQVDPAFQVWTGPGGSVGGITTTVAALYVGAGNQIHKLDVNTGQHLGSVTLEPGATAVSEVTLEGWEGVLVVGTDTGAVFGVPLF